MNQKKNFSQRLKFLLLPAVLLPQVAFAVSDQPDSLADVTTLKDFVFYGKHDPYKEVIPSQTLSGENLATLNSHSVADAVRYFSGVQLKDYGGVGGVKTLDIRSMGTHHMGIFYDGIELGNAQNGQIDLGKYSLDNIESISLYNGQKSNIFQSAKDFGSAGTIYISTKRPKFKEGKMTNLNVTFRSGSFGLANPSFRVERKISDKVSASFNGEYTYANGRYKFRYRKKLPDGALAWDTTATRRNGDINTFRLEGGFFGKTHGGTWYAKAYYFNSRKGIPGAIVNNVWKNSQRQWDQNFFTQGSWQQRFGDKFQTCLNFKYAWDHMRYLNPDTTLMYIDNKFNQNEFYISSANCYTILPGWDVDLSLDYQYNHLSASLTNFAHPTRHTFLTALATSFRRGIVRAQASLLNTFVQDYSKAVSGDVVVKKKSKSLDKVTPAVFVSLQPIRHEEFYVRAFWKRTFRMPTFNDLYYTDIGNVDLKPEVATQYNLGLEWTKGFYSTVFNSLTLSADAYHNRVKDKIIAVPKGTGQYRWMMMNLGDVRINGIDASAQLEMLLPGGVALNGRLSYTWQLARDYSDPEDNIPPAGTYRGQIAYIPRNSGSAVLGAQWRQFHLNYSFIYVGERYHNSSNIPENYEQPWYTHDISASYTLRLGDRQLRGTLEVNNLFNQQYEVIQNYPMPGRNFKVILQFDM